MKILLLGANGQIGFELLRTLAPFGEVVAATRSGKLADGTLCQRADLDHPPSLTRALDDANAGIIVNAAAYTAVDRAEDEPERADRVNHRAVGEIGDWAARHGALVVHYSTDYVFDGRATQPYREDDPTAPLGVYGRSKLAGDEALRASGAAHLVFRTAWVYAARGNNFLRTMLRLGAKSEELRIVADQIGAPTPAGLIADATLTALAHWRDADAQARGALAGVYHMVAGGQCSWYDFANAIIVEATAREVLAHAPAVVPIATVDYPTRSLRPAYSVLDSAKLASTFGLQLADWREGMRAVLGEVAAHTLPSQPSP